MTLEEIIQNKIETGNEIENLFAIETTLGFGELHKLMIGKELTLLGQEFKTMLETEKNHDYIGILLVNASEETRNLLTNKYNAIEI